MRPEITKELLPGKGRERLTGGKGSLFTSRVAPRPFSVKAVPEGVTCAMLLQIPRCSDSRRCSSAWPCSPCRGDREEAFLFTAQVRGRTEHGSGSPDGSPRSQQHNMAPEERARRRRGHATGTPSSASAPGRLHSPEPATHTGLSRGLGELTPCGLHEQRDPAPQPELPAPAAATGTGQPLSPRDPGEAGPGPRSQAGPP